MKALDFNFKINFLDGKPIETFDVKTNVANAIVNQQTSSPQRGFEIAKKIMVDGKFDSLEEDFLLIRNAVLTNRELQDLTKAQILNYLDSIK